MKPIELIGILLLAAGVASLAYQGFTYSTRDELPAVSFEPFRPSHEVVNDRTHEVREKSDGNPNQFVIALARFLHGAINQHPDPKRRRSHQDRDERQK